MPGVDQRASFTEWSRSAWQAVRKALQPPFHLDIRKAIPEFRQYEDDYPDYLKHPLRDVNGHEVMFGQMGEVVLAVDGLTISFAYYRLHDVPPRYQLFWEDMQTIEPAYFHDPSRFIEVQNLTFTDQQGHSVTLANFLCNPTSTTVGGDHGKAGAMVIRGNIARPDALIIRFHEEGHDIMYRKTAGIETFFALQMLHDPDPLVHIFENQAQVILETEAEAWIRGTQLLQPFLQPENRFFTLQNVEAIQRVGMKRHTEQIWAKLSPTVKGYLFRGQQ